MYLSYWGLAARPFHPTPDPRFLYRSLQHEEALGRLHYTITAGLGAALLTGVFGCGKTLVIHTLLRELPAERYKVALITHPQLSYVELLLTIAHDLGVERLPSARSEVLASVLVDKIRTSLGQNHKEGKETVVIVDEAHAIEDPSLMEGLRMLLNFQTDERFLLTLILSGQPELNRKIEELRQFEQRLSIKWHLDVFTATETYAYIHHRMSVAGSKRRVFTDEALSAIHTASGGIPRRINRLCELSLLNGFAVKSDLIDQDIVSQEITGLGEHSRVATPSSVQN